VVPLLRWYSIVGTVGTVVFCYMCTINTASLRPMHPPGAITKDDVDRFKQAFSRPGRLTAALNYYRAIIDAATWAPPTTKRRVGVTRMLCLNLTGCLPDADADSVTRGFPVAPVAVLVCCVWGPSVWGPSVWGPSGRQLKSMWSSRLLVFFTFFNHFHSCSATRLA